jgi:hypothetical protein
MGYHPDGDRTESHDANAMFFQFRRETLSGSPCPRNVKNKDVRLGFPTHDAQEIELTDCLG